MANVSDEQDITKLRFVLYARKSTEDEGRQVNSIDDQVKLCLDYAESHNLRVVKIIREEKSAKKYGNRPQFKDMLADFPKKYDGLLAYHPDRIARNMRDAGVIIDMLNPDNALIKNMAFPTVQYANDSSGRLTLAVLFSLATQYSEHLSETVQRGVDSNLEKGKSSGTPKWGYVRSEISGWYEPDENFKYIQNAWIMRAEGELIEDIVKYLNSHDVKRQTKSSRNSLKPKFVRPSVNSMTKFFRDSFYMGILVQGGQEVDLRTVIDFEPMIMEDVFNKVQTLGWSRSRRKPNSKNGGIFYPFRGMVFCGVCRSERPMSVGKSMGNSGKYFLYYRCVNKDCQRKTKNVRAKDILEGLYETLKTLQFTDKEYKLYSKRLDELTDSKLEELRLNRRSLLGTKTNKERQRDDWSRKLRDMDSSSPAYKVIDQDITDIQNEIIDIEGEINDISDKLQNANIVKMNKADFLNLANTAHDKVLAGSPVEKDVILRKLVLNLYIDDKKAPTFIWREPFATLLDVPKTAFGGAGWNRTIYQVVMSRLL